MTPISMLQLLTSFVLICIAIMWLLNLRQRRGKLALEPAVVSPKTPKKSWRRSKKQELPEDGATDDAAPFMRRRQIVPRSDTAIADALPDSTAPSANSASLPFPEATNQHSEASDRQSDVEPSSTEHGPSEAANGLEELATTAEESVAAVLRRQVMPDEWNITQSWLGGLPYMPESTAWPRTSSKEDPALGEVPLHFVAQIACAELPEDLWAGFGPREGWLLFFVNPNVGSPDDQSPHIVIHTQELGTEQHAPDDLGPVHDKVHTGGSYNWLPIENVPPLWRKWPVEIVSLPNEVHDIDGHASATPTDFASILYDGANVEARLHGTVTTPYTYGQSAHALRSLATRMAGDAPEVANREALNMIVENRALNRLLEGLQKERVQLEALEDTDLRASKLEDLLPRLALVTEVSSAGELVEMLNRKRSTVAQWRTGIAKHCVNLENLLADETDDTPLPLENWEELQQCFIGQSASFFELKVDHNHPDGKGLELVTRTITAELQPADGLEQLAVLDCLDEERSTLVPDKVKKAIEPALRSLCANRPHRMGGYHDGLQTTVEERPENAVLLLQVSSDTAMDWCWGDSGSYYFWINTDDLKNGDFSKVSMTLECC